MSTWMVVEDEPDLYDTLLALFDIWSIDGIAFTNGTDAIKWIDDVDAGSKETNLPELALLDVRLPGASGPEIGAKLRQSPILRNIAIVLTTAWKVSPSEEKEMMEQAQADAWIAKPLPSPREFRKALQEAIAHRRMVSAKDEAESTSAPAPTPAQTPNTVPTTSGKSQLAAD